MPRAACPTSSEHRRFVTVAHVAQDWVVDETGEFLRQEGGDVEVVAPPDAGNIWTCVECGAVAAVSGG